jgi:hypothetical protein
MLPLKVLRKLEQVQSEYNTEGELKQKKSYASEASNLSSPQTLIHYHTTTSPPPFCQVG